MARELSTGDDHVADDDGYTLTRYIAAQERLHGPLRFSFRPVIPIERAKIIDGKRGMNEQQTTIALAKVLEKRIIQWDAKDRKGMPLPVMVNSFTREIHPEQLSRLFQIVVFSADGGDVDPSESFSEDDVNGIPDLLDEDATGLIEGELKN